MESQKTLADWLHQLSSPTRFDRIAGFYAPWCYRISFLLLAIGLFFGIFIAPSDYLQKDAFRIIYIHVPVAILSMGVYVSMAIASIVYYVFHIQLAAYFCRAMAALGAIFTILALFTGALWGKPMWGTFWSWQDPRIMSELILLFLYLGYIALVASIDSNKLGDQVGSILLIAGVINIPIIHYSVVWWNSIHQSATILKLAKPSMTSEMLWPLIICLLGFVFFTAAYALVATRTLVIEAKSEKLLRDRWYY